MASFTAQDVKTLRERTGCGMMDCKKALTETNGDMEAAINYLREKGLAAAIKKASRVAAEGVVLAYSSGNVGVVIEVNSETDFVGKNEDFKQFVLECAKTVAEQNPADVEALAQCKMADGRTVQENLQDKILTIGENIKIRRFARYEGVHSTYIHAGGKIGVMVKFDTTPEIAQTELFQQAAKDIAMQVAAANPLYLDRDSVPADVIEEEKRILTEQVINEGKPRNIAEKIVMGKLGKFYKDNCLVEQQFIKDSDLSVTQYIDSIAKELGGSIKIESFVRFEKGEGLQKREDNFAEEVASMVK
ncbi:MAG TPA: elongation factor Ts [Clostridiales bacterium]|nr:elongation factor Ts [Clostridiales bacterium]